jgi:DNA-binding transcriptional regulator YhcF (GntR family)
MGADCTENEDLPLTHELLSGMLGVRRSTVTEALMELKRAGVVKTYQGGVKIINHMALEAIACECYGAVRVEYRRLLGPSIFQEGARAAER